MRTGGQRRARPGSEVLLRLGAATAAHRLRRRRPAPRTDHFDHHDHNEETRPCNARPSTASLLAACAAAALRLAARAHAQTPTEFSFYYPVAVGGPIAKTIDGFAADFMKDNPGIKVTPIYAGTYQETIVKALTAHKSGTPPVTSVLLSTDMFTLIDEDAIVPFDNFVKTADDKAWLDGFYKAFMMNSQTGGKTWGVPFQRSTVVMYYNKELFKEAGPRPEQAADDLGRAEGRRHQADEEGRQRQGHAVGRADPLQRLPVLAVPDADHAPTTRSWPTRPARR